MKSDDAARFAGYCQEADVCVLCLGTSSIDGHSANDPQGRYSMWSPIQEVLGGSPHCTTASMPCENNVILQCT